MNTTNDDQKKKAYNKEVLYKYVKDYYWSKFQHNTAILSSTCRQLALGLGGISFTSKLNPHYSQLACQANAILLLLVLFFIFDAAQYLKQSVSFYKLATEYDNKIKAEDITLDSLTEKPGMNNITNILFGTKLIILALASMFFAVMLLKT